MRAALGAVAAVALIVVAGCGGDSKQKNAYVDAVNRAQSDFVAVVDDSESRISGNAGDAETANQLGLIQAAAAKAVARLRAVKPPSDVRTLHARLVSEAQGLVGAFQKAVTAYKSGEPAKILSAKVNLSNDISHVNSQLNATIQALNAKLHA